MDRIIGRAPGRVSLAGGGTDLPAYYERAGGAVVSFAIDKYATAFAEPRDGELELVSLDAGLTETIPSHLFARRVRPPILAEEFLLYQKAVAWHFDLDEGWLAVKSDVPTGAGLASSGSLCVALVAAASKLAGKNLDRRQVAEAACSIEMDLLKRECGKQDQYASAFGGLNLIEFFADGSVDLTPVKATIETRAALAGRLMLFHDGRGRSSFASLKEQAARSTSDKETIHALDMLKEMAFEVRELLEGGNPDGVGEVLDRAWTAKQHLNSTLSDPSITRPYALARKAGATGGKLAGAGRAGTLVLYVPDDAQEQVRATLAAEGWSQQAMKMDWEGASVTVTSAEGVHGG